MRTNTRPVVWALAVCAGALSAVTARGAARVRQGAASDDAAYVAALPERPVKQKVIGLCSTCHSIQEAGVPHTRVAWQTEVDEMVARGLTMAPADYDAVVDYLALAFPARVDVNHAPSIEFRAELLLSETDADRIVSYRTTHGLFRRWQDVENVPNIDKAKIEASREFLVADP